ncbi:MAG: Coenzyme F420 hydrogenase/dehydrogenase, beta subunit C-terminal domain [Desulfomonilaceae bacterium]|nr:Coenzyme F420 hydrogenase/dehydrogenase, beta subunit C-terminal domain [Desulfomonilaceae bacterium]
MDQIHGLDELSRRVLDKGLCASCGSCVGRCPYVTEFKGRTVVLHRCTVEHGRCFAYCPMTFFDPEAASRMVFGTRAEASGIGRYEDVKASRATDETVAEAAQGGGTVTSLLIAALNSGMIDSAVLTSSIPGEARGRGFVGTTVAEIASCSGSKFAGSHSLSVLREALDQGRSRIGVVALPCQVRSLRKMALYDLKQEKLRERVPLVIGLFCNWAFSPRQFAEFLGKELGLGHIGKIDIPPPPAQVLEVETQGRTVSVPLDLVRPMIQDACRVCPDMTAEFADVSVGMYEGRPGWNTLVVRTAAGAGVVGEALAAAGLETDVFPSENLEHLKEASEQKRTRAAQ